MASHDQLGLPHSAFNQQAFEDPYLSATSDLEEFSLEQRTPSVSSVDHSSRVPSRSPADNKLTGEPHDPSYEYRQDSFDDIKFVNFDQADPSDPLFFTKLLSVGDSQAGAGLPTIDDRRQADMEPQETEIVAMASNLIDNSQNYSSFSSASDAAAAAGAQAQLSPMPTVSAHTQPSRLTIPDSAYNYTSSPVHTPAKSIPSLSPVVKVSQFHHGDSPTREGEGWTGRGSKRSSVHLSPADDSEGFIETNETMDPDQSPSPSRTPDGSWVRDTATGQAGLDPYARNNGFVPSPKDMEEERQRAEKDADIRVWSASVSQANSEAGDDSNSSPWGQIPRRRRAISAVERQPQDYFGLMQPDDSHIPGPGQLICEDEPGSDFETSSEASQSRSIDELPPLGFTSQTEPLAHQLNRSYPWKDAPQYPFPLAIKTQPESSRDAMKLYEDLTKSMETVSRVGTWGSKGLNDAEVESLMKSDSFFKNLSLNKAQIMKFLRKRSSSITNDTKRHFQRSSRQSSFEPEKNNLVPKKESSIASKLSRRSSLNRSKTGATGVMVVGLAGGLAASIGAASPSTTKSGNSLSTGPWSHSRSRSESIGLAPDLKQFALSTLEQKKSSKRDPSPYLASKLSVGVDGEDDEDDDSGDERGVFMPLTASPQQIEPTFDGFKRQISLLDPRLEPALLNRFAREQLRRYKKLIDEQDKHATLVQKGSCELPERCFASGGHAKLLPPRANAKDPKANYCQFQIPGHENSEDEDVDSDKSGDYTVIPATFAQGIRLPPVKRLPAEFECTLCFKVKKFQKPSDWTKHIYEDILPFTCTFPDCNEPKSFKRKADWVRHETERHRHLEWWVCNMPKCEHKCFRKNNFVQHLVREHGKTDPTAKKTKLSATGGGGNGAGSAKEEIARLWQQVETCRHETEDRPENEPCRFCGNVSKDWRKLMVHLARHMERIALPLLRLAEEHSLSKSETNEMHKKTTPIGPEISVYNTGDPNAMECQTLGAEQPTISYNASQGSNLLSPSINHEVVTSGTTYPPAATSYLQPPYVPAHRNSLSYPPMSSQQQPMTARQETNMSNFGSANGTSSFLLNVSANTLGFEESQQLYQSPQDTCMRPDDIFTRVYDGTPMANFSMAASPEAESGPSNAHAYITQIQSNTYPPTTYQF